MHDYSLSAETLGTQAQMASSAEATTPPNVIENVEAHRPVLRVKSEVTQVSRHILLPVDDTDDSEVAIRWAIDNVYRQGDLFHLLHVIPEPRMVHVWVGMYLPPDEQAELEEVDYTKEFCKHRFVDMLASAKIPFELHVVLGTTDSEAVARVIAHKAEELPADWVVMAQHSKGRLKELWLGSVTKQLVTQAKVPVAVVPHPT